MILRNWKKQASENGKKIINKRFVRKCIKNDIVYFRYEPFSGEDVCNVNHYNEGERRLCENDALILYFGLQIINLPKNIIESFNDVFFFTKYAVDKFEKEFVYFDIKYKKANVWFSKSLWQTMLKCAIMIMLDRQD